MPVIGPGELLVRIAVCGVCASDTMEWYMQPRAPLFIGHEPAGVVEAVGEGVVAFAPGDRVFVHHHVPCLACHDCQRGHETLCATFKRTHLEPAGMAEYVRVPREQVALDVLKLPASMSFEQGALIEPVACCVRALDRAAIRPGDSVAIVGAGFNGLVMTALARRWGARRVFVADRLLDRVQRAGALGADAALVVDNGDVVSALRAANDGRLADVVLVTAGHASALELALTLAGPGATLLLFAPSHPATRLSLAPNHLFFTELNLRASYSCGPQDTRRALSLLAEGAVPVAHLITHRLRLEQAAQAVQITASPGMGLKVLVQVS
jgi:L-iditol 2-dehydrogenase